MICGFNNNNHHQTHEQMLSEEDGEQCLSRNKGPAMNLFCCRKSFYGDYITTLNFAQLRGHTQDHNMEKKQIHYSLNYP